MAKWTIRIIAGLAILIAGLVVLAVASAVVTGSASVGASLSNGRTISAGGHTPCLGLETTKDSAIITTLRHKVVVAPTTVTVDGKFAGAIPASAKSVDIRFEWTRIDVVADAVVVDPTPASTAMAPVAISR
ncbi:MAG TPA: hypothetical protein VH107_01805 [Lacipirellulaceae bacterium]|nr:hypothetical protein [Lacipirellulaceae bacterium]